MSCQATPRRYSTNPFNRNLLSRAVILSAAKLTKFVRRTSQKFCPYAFIRAFFCVALQKNYRLQSWADQISHMTKQSISRQALFQRFDEPCVAFLREVLQQALKVRLPRLKTQTSVPLNAFPQILVEDSSCVKLPPCMKDIYAGVSNGKTETAMAKIQAIFDLRSHQFLSLKVTSYRKNDQSQAMNILDFARPGALVLRDMGYFTFESMKEMQRKNIHFIARLPFHITVSDLEGNEIDLVSDWIRDKDRRERWVQLGADKKLKNRVKVRLIMIKLPKEVAELRKEEARRDKHRTANHSEEYFERQGYTVMVTTVSEDQLTMDQICGLYRMRWRIEIIFKSWKSCFGLAAQYEQVRTKNRYWLEAMLYLHLLFIVMVQAPAFHYFADKAYEKKKVLISWMAFSHFLVNNWWTCTRCFGSYVIDMVVRSCRYDNNKEKINFAHLFLLA